MTTTLAPPDTLRADAQLAIERVTVQWHMEDGARRYLIAPDDYMLLRSIAERLAAHPAASSESAELPCWCDENRPNGRDLCPQHAPTVIAELRAALDAERRTVSSESVELQADADACVQSLVGQDRISPNVVTREAIGLIYRLRAALTAERRAVKEAVGLSADFECSQEELLGLVEEGRWARQKQQCGHPNPCMYEGECEWCAVEDAVARFCQLDDVEGGIKAGHHFTWEEFDAARNKLREHWSRIRAARAGKGETK